MSTRPRPRIRSASLLRRLCVVAMLGFGLALQPTLAAIGELHELAHDPAGTHLVLDTLAAASEGVDGGVDADPGAAAETGDGDRAGDAAQNPAGDPAGLHALLQYAHCCGQMPLSCWTATTSDVPRLASADPPLAEPQLPLHARAFVPFRPPMTT